MGQPDSNIVGRNRELAQLNLIIGPGTDGLRIGLLTGPSGIGKTTLAARAASEARNRGFDVCFARGRSGSLSGALTPWLEALPALSAALDTAPDSFDIDVAASKLMTILSDQTASNPLLLIFDDAQAFDESSIALLEILSQVSDDMNLSVLIIEQTDATQIAHAYRPFIDSIVNRRLVQRLELGSMDDEEIRKLMHALSGEEHVDQIPDELVLRAHGNPWFAHELIAAHLRGDTDVPLTIAAAATSRMNHLSDTEQTLANAIALCPDGAHLRWLENFPTAPTPKFSDATDRLVDMRLVQRSGEVVRIAHPLMRDAMIQEMSAALRRATHRELADAIETAAIDPTLTARGRGYHLHHGGQHDDAVQAYLRAAADNTRARQPHEALADYRSALDVEQRIDHRIDLLKRCGRSAAQLSNPHCGTIWLELARLATARHDNETLAFALVQQYEAESNGSVVDRLHRAAELGDHTYGWSARARALLHTLAGDYASVVEFDSIALRMAQETQDALLETSALLNLGTTFAIMADIEQSIEHFERAIVVASKEQLHERSIIAQLTLSSVLAEDLQTTRALDISTAVANYIADLHLERFRSLAFAVQSPILASLGRLEEAAAISEDAVAAENRFRLATNSPLVWIFRAEILTEIGESSITDPVVNYALELAIDNGWESWIFESRFNLARHLVQVGDLNTALAQVQDLIVDEPVSMARLAQWLVRTGIAHDREDYVARAGAIRTSIATENKLSALILNEIDATLAEDLAQLHAAHAEWSAAERPLDAARTLTTIGLLQRASGDGAATTATLTNARRELAAMGARWEADYLAKLLRDMGSRTRVRNRTTSIGNLTQRELEIARMVATGLRNSDVAEKLFLAEKTVAAHLSNVYSKLELRSRVELRTWMTENDRQSEVELAAV